jgi:ABC-type Mn2+/Zn2+ transport system ATPase subunit
LVHLAQRRVDQLSGGEFQRVLLAQALMGDRAILLLDEPTTGLDRASSAELFAVLQRLRQVQGLTLLIVSHDLDWVARGADQILYLNNRTLQATPQVVMEPSTAQHD